MRNLSLIMLFLLSTFCFSQETDFSKIPQLQTQATYTTEVKPDRIILSIKLSEKNSRGKVSVEELERKIKKVLIDNNVDIEKQLKLTDLSSDFQEYFLRKKDIQKVKNYHLELYNAKTTAHVLKGLEDNNISNIQLVKTEYSKLEELKIELKGYAVLKAKKQAEEMVKTLNQKLGKAIFISDLKTNIYNNQTLNSFNYNGYNVKSEDKELDIDFEKIKVSTTVTVYFRID